ncbi:DUF4232 domain-containing protein [Micromonospora soli]|uniref:DUF4232 domain-containing protein n=1 Tax=Micromonospora sp. NBRC 110009 TaxID=3061627 RepID=UPI00267141C0|nr:DUF4232 domain-containing protein [Micromonospora sp. NBRC 110009]WKT96430.1 DUF4232 domain-containing protein [Micromonospora sp. NBRC 110009]
MTGNDTGRRAARRAHRTVRLATLLAAGAAVVAFGGCTTTDPGPAGAGPAGSPTGSVPAGPTSLPATPAASPTSAPATAPPTPAAITGCRTADLSAASAGSSGHMGSETAYLALTNRTGRRCALSGFPQVRLADAGGRVLRVEVRHHLGAHRVVLAPGGTAWTAVTFSHVPRSDDEPTPCDPPADALWLTPPGGTGHLVLRGAWSACGGAVEVDSFTAGRPPAA